MFVHSSNQITTPKSASFDNLSIIRQIIYMNLTQLKRYYGALTGTLKKFYWKDNSHQTAPAVPAKTNLEERRFDKRKCATATDSRKGKWYFLAQELNMPVTDIIHKCRVLPAKRKYKLKLKDVVASLEFLRSYGFQNPVIAESVVICLYPVKQIQKGLEQIVENEDNLSMFDLKDGFTYQKEQVNCGTSFSDKRLQLCLYYIELPHDFTGKGCLIED